MNSRFVDESGHSPDAPGVRASGRRESAVVVAVPGVRVMQVAGDEVVDVVAMRYRFVPATRAVDMTLGVTCAAVRRRARGRIGRADLDDTLVDVAIVVVVEVAVVEVVDVVAMADREVATVGAVDVIVMRMGGVAHGFFFLPWCGEVTTARSAGSTRRQPCARFEVARSVISTTVEVMYQATAFSSMGRARDLSMTASTATNGTAMSPTSRP